MKRPVILFCQLVFTGVAFAELSPMPIVQSAMGGHVHPSIARTSNGTLVVAYQSKGVLMRACLTKGAENWEAPKVIPGTDWRPEYIQKTPHVEVYPCSLDRLPECKVPLHVIAFSEDVQTPPQRGRLLADSAQEGHFHLLEGLGHCSAFAHRPDVVNDCLLGVLQQYR